MWTTLLTNGSKTLGRALSLILSLHHSGGELAAAIREFNHGGPIKISDRPGKCRRNICGTFVGGCSGMTDVVAISFHRTHIASNTTGAGMARPNPSHLQSSPVKAGFHAYRPARSVCSNAITARRGICRHKNRYRKTLRLDGPDRLHKPSYRSVTPLDARRLPTSN